MPIIQSILDTDLYKLSMQQAVLELFPDAEVTYQFTNRRKDDKFTQKMIDELQISVNDMADQAITLTQNEYKWLKETCPYFKSWYLEYLRDYVFDPKEVKIELNDGALDITITGPWHKTILWEVPLMAMISTIYFHNTAELTQRDMLDYFTRTADKRDKLIEAGCTFSEFGSRRRRNFQIQDMCVRTFATGKVAGEKNPFFGGTSNVHLARTYGVTPIGTMAHEWIMGTSELCSLKHANRYALENWVKVYNGDLGIALTDTYGTEAFFKDFNLYFAKLYDGVRHDSGCPYKFADKVIDHYKKLGINPMTKKIIFSDGLDVDEAIKIKKYCEDRIPVVFGIGTHFTNDVPGSKALNIVIKLRTVNGEEVVKISDNPIKATGDGEALSIAFKTFKLN